MGIRDVCATWYYINGITKTLAANEGGYMAPSSGHIESNRG